MMAGGNLAPKVLQSLGWGVKYMGFVKVAFMHSLQSLSQWQAKDELTRPQDKSTSGCQGMGECIPVVVPI